MPVLEARISDGYVVASRADAQRSAIATRLRGVHLDLVNVPADRPTVRVGTPDGLYAVEVTADSLKPLVRGVWVARFPQRSAEVEHVEFYLRELLPAIRTYLGSAASV